MCGSNSKVQSSAIALCTEELKLKIDSRRAMFHMGANNYNAKLVDLPCIIESQKTLDNKQMFKVADICQVHQLILLRWWLSY